MSNTFSLNDIGRRYHATNAGSNNVVSIDNNDVTNLAGALTIKEGTQNNRIITSINSSSPAEEQLVISHNGNDVEIDNVNTNASPVIKFLSDVTFTKPVYITESGLGTSASGHGGTIVLQHQTSGGRNSITFRSAINAGYDHGAIEYVEGDGTNERGILRLIAENDGDGQFEDQVRVRIAGSDIVRFASNGVSVDTSSDPSYTLDVGGDGRFSDELLVMDAKIGVISSAAAFANNAHFDIDSYALRQTNSGDTVINTVNGKKIWFRVDNDGNKEMSFDGSKLLLPGRGKLEINQGGYGCYLWGGKYASNQNKDEAILATPNGNHFLRFIDHRGSGSFNQQIMIGRSGSHNQLYIFGVYFYQSDDRLKHQEVDIENGLDLIRQLQPQKYKKTSEKKDADYVGELEDNSWKWESGLIAQDVAKIPDLSHCVQYNSEEDLYFLNYNDIFSTNIAATKELDSIVQTQQTLINELKEEINQLKAETNELKVETNELKVETNELKVEINTLKDENTLLKTKLNELLTDAGKETI